MPKTFEHRETIEHVRCPACPDGEAAVRLVETTNTATGRTAGRLAQVTGRTCECPLADDQCRAAERAVLDAARAAS